jgi:hypothetical protein
MKKKTTKKKETKKKTKKTKRTNVRNKVFLKRCTSKMHNSFPVTECWSH